MSKGQPHRGVRPARSCAAYSFSKGWCKPAPVPTCHSIPEWPRLEGPLEIIWCNPLPSRITWSTRHRMAPGGLQIPPDILSITRARPAPGKGPLSSAQLCQHQPPAARRATACLPPGKRRRRSRTWHREAWEATSKKKKKKTAKKPAAHSMPLRAVLQDNGRWLRQDEAAHVVTCGHLMGDRPSPGTRGASTLHGSVERSEQQHPAASRVPCL